MKDKATVAEIAERIVWMKWDMILLRLADELSDKAGIGQTQAIAAIGKALETRVESAQVLWREHKERHP